MFLFSLEPSAQLKMDVKSEIVTICASLQKVDKKTAVHHSNSYLQ